LQVTNPARSTELLGGYMKREHWFLVIGICIGLALGGVRCSVKINQSSADAASMQPNDADKRGASAPSRGAQSWNAPAPESDDA
jgi:hypothetical protein